MPYNDAIAQVLSRYVKWCGDNGVAVDMGIVNKVQVGWKRGVWAASVVQCGDEVLGGVVSAVGGVVSGGELSLQVSEAGVGEVTVNALKEISSVLVSLSLQNTTVPLSPFRTLVGAVQQCAKLTSLSVDRCHLSEMATIHLLTVLPSLPSLASLSLCQNNLTPTTMTYLVQLLPSLTSLDISENRLNAHSVPILTSALAHSKTLETLSVCDTGIIEHPEFIEALGANTSITHLKMSGNAFPDVYDPTILGRVFGARQAPLLLLHMSNCKNVGRFLGQGLAAACGELHTLNLSNNKGLVGGDVAAFAELKKMRVLDISMCGLDEAGLKVVGEAVRRSKKLNEVSIKGNCDVGEAATVFDACVAAGTHVSRDLDLSGVWSVSAGSVRSRRDMTYTITNVRHDLTTGEITGTLPGKDYGVWGKFSDPDAIELNIDWKNNKLSKLVLTVSSPPHNPNTPILNMHAASRIHLSGKLFNEYDQTDGDMAVVIQPSKQFSKVQSCLKAKIPAKG